MRVRCGVQSYVYKFMYRDRARKGVAARCVEGRHVEETSASIDEQVSQ